MKKSFVIGVVVICFFAACNPFKRNTSKLYALSAAFEDSLSIIEQKLIEENKDYIIHSYRQMISCYTPPFSGAIKVYSKEETNDSCRVIWKNHFEKELSVKKVSCDFDDLIYYFKSYKLDTVKTLPKGEAHQYTSNVTVGSVSVKADSTIWSIRYDLYVDEEFTDSGHVLYEFFKKLGIVNE
ncbi:hypothetical protein RCC89_07290 [Cytophagaceae bacterium ABcell3]|nr:hypothetical protein RCC89_07290 [Cytophagaceae bacterium ABcell3]